MADQKQPWHVAQVNGCWFLREINRNGGEHSLSFGRDGEVEARAKLAEWTANGTCKECGDVLNDDWIPETKARINARQLCVTCLFWTDYVETASDPTHVVVNGHHYVIAPDKPNSRMQGHGGAEFTIEFKDGRRVVSCNLWAQGDIPEHFRERLRDNATFVARGHRRIGNWPGAGGYRGLGTADTWGCEG